MRSAWAHPRVRGDVGVCGNCEVSGFVAAHPRVRGDVATHPERIHVQHGLTPACAGTSGPCRRHHRVAVGSPPRARGRRCRSGLVLRLVGLTPACAGTSAKSSGAKRDSGAHPRVRGDVPSLWRWLNNFVGSPPRARGRRSLMATTLPNFGLTPACAGTSACRPAVLWRARAHPRVRGDVHTPLHTPLRTLGSPPRARGRPRSDALTRRALGLTPACAGTSRSPRLRPRRQGAHPRVRGDVGAFGVQRDGSQGLTPACAGTSCADDRARAAGRGLTPACAGTSTTTVRVISAPWAHPRVRGDVRDDVLGSLVALGSPPRARGRRQPTGRARNRRGLTPACAGTSLSGSWLV